MNEFTEQFLVEARELAERASADLLRMEETPPPADALESAFRAFHTLKGAAGIMEYAEMERMLHRAEDVLQELRAGRAQTTPVLIDALLAGLGQLVRWFDVIEATDVMPADAAGAADRAIAMLAQASGGAQAPAASVKLDESWVGDLLAWAARQKDFDNATAASALRHVPDIQCFFRGEDPLGRVANMDGLLALRLTPAAPWPPLEELQPFEANLVVEAVFSRPGSEIAGELKAASGKLQIVSLASQPGAGREPSTEARQILAEQKALLDLRTGADEMIGRFGAAGRVAVNVLSAEGMDTSGVRVAVDTAIRNGDAAALLGAIDAVTGASAEPVLEQSTAAEAPSARDSGTIRVDVEKLDALVNLTGELLVVKNALAHWAKVAGEGGDPRALAAGLKAQQDLLGRHLADLQRTAFGLRVVPLGRVFSRFPRLVRETASSLGKQVTFYTEGDDTQADKAVVDALFEPLLHILRNAIDHGVETVAARQAAGKPAAAQVALRGWREGEHVIVEVTDDGRGVDPVVIRRLAVARGVVDEAGAAAMSDDQAVALIFAPGFSTAESVTDLSGRGVGMAAVRAAIERVGGAVQLINRPGEGLTIRLVLPFTVMLTRVMTVSAGGQVFGLPFDAVTETVRIPRGQVRPLGAGHAFVLRDETIPVIDLAQSLGLGGGATPAADACIVVVSAGGARAGLEIDRPGERMDMMLKPVEGILSSMRAIAGTSLLGDGQVLIVLDLRELVS